MPVPTKVWGAPISDKPAVNPGRRRISEYIKHNEFKSRKQIRKWFKKEKRLERELEESKS